jgi:hypothetical protein
MPPPEVPEGHGYLDVEGVGLEAPQSILHDLLAEVYRVRNLGPHTGSPESQGFISRL